MKILDKYILRTFITTFASVFIILFLIFILQTVWLFIAELSGKGLDLELILKFLLYKMPSVVPLVIPLSVLLASIMTFGDLAENYEFAAMKSAGISLTRAIKMLTIFICVFSVGAFFFANNVIPFAEYKFVNLRKNIAQKKPAMAIAEGQFSTVGPYSIKVDKKSGENGNTLTGVTIHQKSSTGEGNKIVIKAKNGQLQGDEKTNLLKLVLYQGYYYEDIIPKKYEERNKLPFAKASFKTDVINIDLAKLNNVNINDESVTNTDDMLNVAELKYTLDSLNKNYKKDVISFTDNIYPRTGISNVNKKIKSTNQSEDVIQTITIDKRKDIISTALNNVESTIFSIDGSKMDLEFKQKNINSHWIAMYDKFVLAFSCILMFFIGAPLGAIIKKGGLGLPIVFAVLIFIIFHFVNTFGKKVAQENGMPPVLGCWLSTLILLPLAVLLTYKATNDIAMTINIDFITQPIQKILQKIMKKKQVTNN
ncbi:MAG: LptF/LptG family permease [Flavobacterium sp.]|nr:LptF/LptG family permease [Flavobacterium sp.]